MQDLEIALVRAFGWSLHDIDETDIGSLAAFVQRLTANKTKSAASAKTVVYCDQVGWL